MSPEFDLWLRLEATPDLLADIAAESGDALGVQKRLRERYDADLVRLALMLVEQRRKAASKFSRAADMWFDAVRVEQATSETVAKHKAARFDGDVVDLCCGLGADTLALAARGAVTAVDLDPVCQFFVTRNARAYGVEANVSFECADANAFSRDRLIHIDPDRRAGGQRVRRLEQYEPGLEFLQGLATNGRGGAIKVSAAANFGGKFPGCEIELVSFDRECKEATIWFGELSGPSPWRATSLPSGETITGDPLDAVADVVAPMAYLFDPDPALVRSGLIDLFCEQRGICRLDDAEEYLTGDDVCESAFVTMFRVVDQTANNDKQIRRMLKAHDVGPLEVKTRHVPVDANAVQRKFAGKGERPAVLFIARLQGKTRAVLCERV